MRCVFRPSSPPLPLLLSLPPTPAHSLRPSSTHTSHLARRGTKSINDNALFSMAFFSQSSVREILIPGRLVLRLFPNRRVSRNISTVSVAPRSLLYVKSTRQAVCSGTHPLLDQHMQKYVEWGKKRLVTLYRGALDYDFFFSPDCSSIAGCLAKEVRRRLKFSSL